MQFVFAAQLASSIAARSRLPRAATRSSIPRCGQQLPLRSSRLELIVSDGDQKSSAFVAEAVPAIAPGPQDLAVLMPDHQQSCKLEPPPKHQFQRRKRSAAAL